MAENKVVELKHWLMLIFLSLVWGSSFILMKKTLVNIDSKTLACLRIGITALAFLPYVLYIRKKIDLNDWWKYTVIGLTTTGIPSFCFAFAQNYLSSATTGILNSLTPIITLLVSVTIFKVKFQLEKLVGVVLGFLGAGILIYGTSEGNLSASVTGFFIVFLATICYGFNANLVKHYFANTNPLVVSAGAFTSVGIPVVIYALFAIDFPKLVSDDAHINSLLAVIALALICTLVANIVFYKLVQDTSPVFASSVTFLIPVVACFWALLDGEPINHYHIISTFFIILALIVLRKK
jgi:drug/metabolite transporter (DMT)-like permease